MSITSVEIKACAPSVNEVLRYMKAGQDPDREIIDTVEGAIKKIHGVASGRACYVKCSLELVAGKIKLGSLEIQSDSLKKRLDGCREAYVFAATVGSEVDRIIRLESARSNLLGLCADAAGSAMVESVCDELNKQISDICISQGKSTRSRFSAGYGDMPLELQKSICAILDTKKNIGVALGDGCMMMPSKSVTAIIGVY